MAEETLQTGYSCGIAALSGLPIEPGHNDDIDLQFMLAVLKAAHDLVADPESGWRKKYPNVQDLRKYVRYFVSEQLRSYENNESADPNLDRPTTESVASVTNTACAVCRSNYFACMQTVPQPPDCYDRYMACVQEPCS